MFQLVATTKVDNHRMILCLDGEFHHERFVDVKVGMTRKTWKTAKGAEKYAAERWNSGGRSYCVAEEVGSVCEHCKSETHPQESTCVECGKLKRWAE